MLCWAVHLNAGPKRANHAAVALGHKVFSFGGFCTGETYMYDMDQIDVHIFNTVSLRWTKLPPAVTPRGEHPPEFPCPRHGHTAVLIDKIYIWGGLTDRFEYCNVLFTFDVDTHGWFKPNVSGAVPEARYMHSACVVGKAMFIFGGFNWTRCTNDMYKLDTATIVWLLINPGGTPAPVLLRHSATVIGTKMFLFGGREDQMDQREDQYNNIRVFDTETNCWLSTPPAQLRPEGRMCHSAFTYNGELYIFGGNNCHLNRTVKFNDLWKFNAGTFSWRKVEPKGKSYIYRCLDGPVAWWEIVSSSLEDQMTCISWT